MIALAILIPFRAAVGMACVCAQDEPTAAVSVHSGAAHPADDSSCALCDAHDSASSDVCKDAGPVAALTVATPLHAAVRFAPAGPLPKFAFVVPVPERPPRIS